MNARRRGRIFSRLTPIAAAIALLGASAIAAAPAHAVTAADVTGTCKGISSAKIATAWNKKFGTRTGAITAADWDGPCEITEGERGIGIDKKSRVIYTIRGDYYNQLVRYTKFGKKKNGLLSVRTKWNEHNGMLAGFNRRYVNGIVETAAIRSVEAGYTVNSIVKFTRKNSAGKVRYRLHSDLTSEIDMKKDTVKTTGTVKIAKNGKKFKTYKVNLTTKMGGKIIKAKSGRSAYIAYGKALTPAHQR